MAIRTYCEACGTYRFKPDGELCFHCKPAAQQDAIRARQEARAASATPHPPVVFGGQSLDAPGFTSDQFERAILRAFMDDLQIRSSSQAGRYIVSHPGGHAYRTTREACSCRAGTRDIPCKHRALVVLHADVREPHLWRQWTKLHGQAHTQEAA